MRKITTTEELQHATEEWAIGTTTIDLVDYILLNFDISHLQPYISNWMKGFDAGDIAVALTAWQKQTIDDVTDEAPMSDFEQDLYQVMDEIATMLVEKNRKYGDAALNPQRIFARADTVEQINIRIDDKLNRIKNRQNDEDEDPESDLIGYLLLKRIVKKRLANEQKEKKE